MGSVWPAELSSLIGFKFGLWFGLVRDLSWRFSGVVFRLLLNQAMIHQTQCWRTARTVYFVSSYHRISEFIKCCLANSKLPSNHSTVKVCLMEWYWDVLLPGSLISSQDSWSSVSVCWVLGHLPEQTFSFLQSLCPIKALTNYILVLICTSPQNISVELYREHLGLHGLVFVLTCSMTCETLYGQVFAFLNYR